VPRPTAWLTTKVRKEPGFKALRRESKTSDRLLLAGPTLADAPEPATPAGSHPAMAILQWRCMLSADLRRLHLLPCNLRRMLRKTS